MRAIKSLSLSLLACSALFVAGCASSPRAATSATTPFTAEQLETLRSSYKTPFPNARIGVVTAVLADQPFALVSDIDGAAAPVGSILTFLDANQTVITNGRVELINASGLTVRFDEGKRRPVVGDAAIKF